MTGIYSKIKHFFSSTLQGTSLAHKNPPACTSTLPFAVVNCLAEVGFVHFSSVDQKQKNVSEFGVQERSRQENKNSVCPVASVKRGGSGVNSAKIAEIMREKVNGILQASTNQTGQTISDIFTSCGYWISQYGALYSFFRQVGAVLRSQDETRNKSGVPHEFVSRAYGLIALSVFVLLILQLSQLQIAQGVLV